MNSQKNQGENPKSNLKIGQISTELCNLSETSDRINGLVGAIEQRFSSVLNYEGNQGTDGTCCAEEPLVPLAKNVRDIYYTLNNIENRLQFILRDCEL